MPPDDLSEGPEPTAPSVYAPSIPLAPPRQSRATQGGKRLRWLAFLIGIAGLGLGAIAIRSASILSGRIDPDLATTPELATSGTLALGLQAALLVLTVAFVVAGTRWARRTRSSLAELGDPNPLLKAAPRTGRLALTLGVGGLALIVVAALGLLVPVGRDVTRAFWVMEAFGALVLPIAAGLAIWLIGDIERREAIPIHAADPWQPAPGERDRRWPMAAIAVLAVCAVIPPAADLQHLWSEHACQDADLECRWVIVQADQLANDPRGATAVLHYAIRHATGPSRGTLVIATGGPGVSGVTSFAESAGTLDTRLTDAYDIVVFDARDVGESGYADCPVASQRYRASLTFTAPPSVITDFVDACIDEAAVDPATLGQYGSTNLAEDVETIRRDLGVDRIALYGESYGTVVAQRYAAAHPEHLEALILDGAIDVGQPTDDSWVEATRGFENVLTWSLGTCISTDGCRFHDASVWSNVMKSVEGGNVVARYADVDGVVTDWPLSADMVRETLLNAMYDVGGRMLVLRALTAAEAGDWVPLARLVYSGQALGDIESVSDFAYYATSCADRHGTVPEPDAAGFMAKARSSLFASSRTGSVYLSSAACYAWPVPADRDPPVAVPSSADFPVVILTATGDPITPAAHGRRIYERYRRITDTYLVRTQDGPHVTFGRGWECPDDLVVDLLLTDTRPAAGTSCPGELVSPFLELPSEDREGDPLEFRGRALDLELLAHPDYVIWDGLDTLVVGCRYGGRLEVTSEGGGEDFVDTIKAYDCAVVKDEPMSGTGSYRGTDEAEFDIDSPAGAMHYRIVGEWRYTMFAETSIAWDGTFKGRSIVGRR